MITIFERKCRVTVVEAKPNQWHGFITDFMHKQNWELNCFSSPWINQGKDSSSRMFSSWTNTKMGWDSCFMEQHVWVLGIKHFISDWGKRLHNLSHHPQTSFTFHLPPPSSIFSFLILFSVFLPNLSLFSIQFILYLSHICCLLSVSG